MDRDFPPPFPYFLLSVLTAILNIIHIIYFDANDSCLPPPLPPLPNIVSVVITFLLIALSSNSLIQALFPGLIFQKNVGRDVWSYLEEDPRKFWYLTGDTPQSLDILVHMISHEIV